MNRFIWISSWERPTQKWCDLGHRTVNGTCGIRHNIEPFEIRANPAAIFDNVVVSNPTVTWNSVSRRRFNVLERSQERMREALDAAAHARLLNYSIGLENAER